MPGYWLAVEKMTAPVLAVELDRAIQRLRARIRAESGVGASAWSRSQLLALDRLIAGPPMTTSDLAAAEYVRPQSMAATLAPLLDAGLVTRHRDPDDGRRVLIVPTDAGRDALRSVQSQRDAWLASAIERELDEEELAVLPGLVQLLDRLADSDTPPVTPARRNPLRVAR
jgi:DNA-binding MarR family transcriptional regulator